MTPPRDRPDDPAPARLLLAVFAASLAVLWIAAAPREITKDDEHRYITVAREMFVSGDWLVCRLNGEVYAHKPPGVFWAMAAARSLGFGWTAAAKVPSVLAGAAVATLTFDLARRFWGRAAAWTSALAVVTAKEFLTLSVRGQIDPFLTLWTTLTLWAAARALLFGAAPASRTRLTALAFAAAGCGVLVKGPVAFVVTGGPVLAFLLWDRGLRGLVTWRWALAPLAVVPGALWAVAAAARAPEGWGYVRDLALGHGVAHAAGQVDKLEAWHFYLVVFPIGLLPWTLLLPAAVQSWRTDRGSARRSADRFAMAWPVAGVVLLSLSPAKRDLYLLPLYPGAALLFGRLATTLAADGSRLERAAVRWGLRAVAGAAVLSCAALGAAGISLLARSDDWIGRVWPAWEEFHELLEPHVPWAAVTLGAAIGALGVALFRARGFPAVARAAGGSMLAFALAVAIVHAPFTEALMSPRVFLERVRERVGTARLGDYGGTAYAANWLCDRTVVPVVGTRRAAERFLDREPGPAYLVCERVRLAEKGMPGAAQVILEDPRKGRFSMVLIGRE